MITDPCKCGIKPTSHAHITNSKYKEQIIWWKGAPIVMDDPKEKEYFMLNTGKTKIFPTRRKGVMKSL